MPLLPSKEKIEQAAQGGTVGDGLAKGVDFAGVILVFFGIGWLLDRGFGTTPWFMVGLTLFGVVGQLVRTWYAYDADMRAHEAERERRLTVADRSAARPGGDA